MLNNSKSSIPPLFSQFEVLTSTAGNVECYAWNVSSNSTHLEYPLEWRPYWVICTYYPPPSLVRHHFQIRLSQGKKWQDPSCHCFPACWKSSSSSCFWEPSNYCSISLLPHFGKLFKALINAEVVKHLNSHDFLLDKQYGFHFTRSTTEVLSHHWICIWSSWWYLKDI